MRDRILENKSRNLDIGKDIENYYEEQNVRQPYNFNKMRVGAQTVEDAIVSIGELKKINSRLTDKLTILRAIEDCDLVTLRDVSNFFYKASGIYSRILRYMAFMYRYDWFISPYVYENPSDTKDEKQLSVFYKALKTLDDFNVKKNLGEIALCVLRNGVYYGYKIETATGIVLQELPVNYCRCRIRQGKNQVVEFNLRFFDDYVRDTTQRMIILKAFPQEFLKAYLLYKKGKLPKLFPGDSGPWFALDPKMTVRFTANGEEYPAFVSIIPLILDLDEAQEVDRKKTLQRLLKLVIQKIPLDKNGDPVFDIDEGQQLHNNAVQMLSRAIGVDVLTTFADVNVESLSDTNVAAAQTDDLDRRTNQIYTESGVSLQQFNSDNSIALEKSIANDAATMYNMLLQFEEFLNDLIAKHNNKKITFKAQILTTTIYNYQEMAKLYKEQMQLGFSKILPQIALGQSQSAILANAYFENKVLNLVDVFIPPLMSSTMNGDTISKLRGGGSATGSDSEGTGRPTNAEQGKPVSEKTIANREAAANN